MSNTSEREHGELAFQLVPLLDLPETHPVTAIAALGANVFVGTSRGTVQHFKMSTNDDEHLGESIFRMEHVETFQIFSMRSTLVSSLFSSSLKKAKCISMLKISVTLQTLFILCDNVIQLYKTTSMKYIQRINLPSIHSFDIQDCSDSIRICCASSTRIYILSCTSDYEITTEKELFAPSTAMAIQWVGREEICVGFKHAFVIVNSLSYAVEELCTFNGKIDRPLISLHRSTLVLATGKSLEVFPASSTGMFHKSQRKRVYNLDEMPRALALTHGFAIAALKFQLQVVKLGDRQNALSRFPHAQLIELCEPQLMVYDEMFDHIFVLTEGNLWFLQPIDLQLKVIDLKFRDRMRLRMDQRDLESVASIDIIEMVGAHLDQVLSNKYHPFGFSILKFADEFSFSTVESAAIACRTFVGSLVPRVMEVWPELLWRRDLDVFVYEKVQSQVLLTVSSKVFQLISEHNRETKEKLVYVKETMPGLGLDSFSDDFKRLEAPSFQTSIHLLDEFIDDLNIRTKMDTLQRFFDDVSNVTHVFWSAHSKQVKYIAADDLLSVLCYIVYCYSNLSLVDHLLLLSDFVFSKDLNGKLGYYLTSLQLAVSYVSDMQKGAGVLNRDIEEQHDMLRMRNSSHWNEEKCEPLEISDDESVHKHILEY